MSPRVRRSNSFIRWDRIRNLIIECFCQSLMSQISKQPPEDWTQKLRMSQENFERFRDLVLKDDSLQGKLMDISDYQTFTESVVKLGNERGFAFTALEVEAAINS